MSLPAVGDKVRIVFTGFPRIVVEGTLLDVPTPSGNGIYQLQAAGGKLLWFQSFAVMEKT